MSDQLRKLSGIFMTALAASFLLCGYEFLRSSSNTLFKSDYGVSGLPYVMALIPIVVFLTVYLYDRLLSLFGPRKTLLFTTLGSGVFILLCHSGIKQGYAPASALLYLFREAYIVLIIEQYWSFINSSVKEGLAKKVNGPIIGVSSIGAVIGGYLLHLWVKDYGTANMLLFTALSMIPCAFFSDIGYKLLGEPQPKQSDKNKKHDQVGFSEFKTYPILWIIFLVIIATQILSTMVGLRFQDILQIEMPDPDIQTAFSGLFFSYLNGAAAAMQFIITPIALRYIPVRIVHIIIPLVHLGTCFALMMTPTLFTAGTAYFVFKTFDYSIFRAAKEILYIPLSFDARYRAKEFIDVFGYRLGKGGTSFLIVIAQRITTIASSAFSIIAMIAAMLWLALVIPLTRKPQQNEKIESGN